MSKLFYYILFSFFWLITWLPLSILYLISDFFFLIIFYVARYRRKLVRKNLSNSFPELSITEIKKIERKFYRHLCDYFIETLKLMHFRVSAMRKRVQFPNIDTLFSYYEKNQSVLLYLGHYGNWEWLSLAKYAQKTDIKDFKIYPVYHTLSNKYFDKFFYRLRSNIDSTPIPQEKILRTIIEKEREKSNSIYIFIADQSTTVRNIHYWMNFLNQDTPCITGAERIAKQTGYPTLYADVRKTKRGHYSVEFIPIEENPKEAEEFQLTDSYMKLLEKTIQRDPAYWLWTHNRWKHKRKK